MFSGWYGDRLEGAPPTLDRDGLSVHRRAPAGKELLDQHETAAARRPHPQLAALRNPGEGFGGAGACVFPIEGRPRVAILEDVIEGVRPADVVEPGARSQQAVRLRTAGGDNIADPERAEHVVARQIR